MATEKKLAGKPVLLVSSTINHRLPGHRCLSFPEANQTAHPGSTFGCASSEIAASLATVRRRNNVSLSRSARCFRRGPERSLDDHRERSSRISSSGHGRVVFFFFFFFRVRRADHDTRRDHAGSVRSTSEEGRCTSRKLHRSRRCSPRRTALAIDGTSHASRCWLLPRDSSPAQPPGERVESRLLHLDSRSTTILRQGSDVSGRPVSRGTLISPLRPSEKPSERSDLGET